MDTLSKINLKYGCNPHQKPASVFIKDRSLPFSIKNGSASYINFCDALNSWQLVKELSSVLHLPAAASFKHVSPAGAAVAIPMSPQIQKASFVDDCTLSPLATAYARARGADRVSSFGDWIALSETVDESTATIIKREVSDGIIAPGYSKTALEVLKSKKEGKYVIIEIDPEYEPPELEQRDVFGITLQQKRNNVIQTKEHLSSIVTRNKHLDEQAQCDLLISLITLKYTQSNSVCFSYNGQVIGIGAGQQSRIHCTRLAAAKADRWFLRQHPSVLNLHFKQDVSRVDKNNAIDQYLEDNVTEKELAHWSTLFETIPQKLTQEEKQIWLNNTNKVSVGSDGFFPFRDTIDRLHASNVGYIAQPGGSKHDNEVIEACDEYGILMTFTGLRLFHH